MLRPMTLPGSGTATVWDTDMTEKPYSFREHRRKAKAHFLSRWKARVRANPPDIDLLAQEFRDEMNGRGHGMLKLLHPVEYHSSRWLARMGDREVVITYNHKLGLPTTVWENPKGKIQESSEPA